MADFPAIALLEFCSIAIGTRATDALAKKAPVQILRAGSLQPGKYAILFGGDVASVIESDAEAVRVGEAGLIDRVFLPDIEPRLLAAISGTASDWNHDTIGIIETMTLSGVIAASDAALKGAAVEILRLQLGDGLHGKGVAHFGGIQADVEAAIAIGTAAMGQRPDAPCTTIIPRMDDDVRQRLARSTLFSGGK